MEKLIELFQQIQELAAAGAEALQSAMQGGAEGGAPPEGGGGGEPPAEAPPEQ